MPDYSRTLAGGIAEYLDDNGLATWDYFGAIDYTTADVWPVFIGPDMPASPDRLICVTPGVVTRIRADIIVNIQIRLRGTVDGDVSEIGNQAQAIADLFYPNGFPLVHVALGPVRVGAVLPGDTLPIARDESRRHGHVQNFRIRARRP